MTFLQDLSLNPSSFVFCRCCIIFQNHRLYYLTLDILFARESINVCPVYEEAAAISRNWEVGSRKLEVGSRKSEVGRPFSAFVHTRRTLSRLSFVCAHAGYLVIFTEKGK